MTARERRWAVLVPLGTALFCWVWLEAVLYGFLYVKHGLLPHRIAARDFYPYEHHYMEDHPYLPYLAMQGRYDRLEFNSQGDRGPELDRPKKRVRILCYGGSTTFDAAHEWKDTWPGQLQALLGPERYEVVIAAQNGATTADSVVNYALIHSQDQADYVLAYEGNNDLESSFCADFRPDYAHRRRKIAVTRFPLWRVLPRWLDWSAAYVVVRGAFTVKEGSLHDLYTRPCLKPDLAGGPYGVPVFERNLLNLDALARANGAKLVLGTFQYYRAWAEKKMTPGFAEAWDRGSRLENDVIRALAAKRPGLVVADIARTFTPSEKTMLDFCHLTEEGNAHVARGFYKELKRLEAARGR